MSDILKPVEHQEYSAIDMFTGHIETDNEVDHLIDENNKEGAGIIEDDGFVAVYPEEMDTMSNRGIGIQSGTIGEQFPLWRSKPK